MRIPRLHKEISLFSRDERKNIGAALRMLADRISLVVTGDSTSSSLTITEGAMEAITGQLTIKGSDGTTTVVEGGAVQAESIKADDIDVDSITIGQSQVNDLDDALDDAAATAEDFITHIANNGIWVTPESAKPSAQGQPVSATRGWHIADALELFHGTSSMIRAWVEEVVVDGVTEAIAKVRVGDESGGNTLIESDGVSVRNATTTLAKFASDLVEIGKNSASAVISFCGGRGYIYSSTNGDIRMSSHDRGDDLGDTEASAFMSLYSSATSSKASMSALPYGPASINWAEAAVRCEAGSASTPSASIVSLIGNRLKIVDEPSYDSTTVTMAQVRELFSSSWSNLSLDSSKCQAYSSAQTPKYARCGNVVTICGAVSPKANYSASADSAFHIGLLPAGNRPVVQSNFICQGSGTATWMLEVNTDGDMYAKRVRNENGWASFTTSAWFTFSVTFVAGS